MRQLRALKILGIGMATIVLSLLLFLILSLLTGGVAEKKGASPSRSFYSAEETTKIKESKTEGSSRKTVRVKDTLGEADDPAHDSSCKVESTNEVPLQGENDVVGLPGSSLSSILIDQSSLNTSQGEKTQLSAKGEDSLGFPVTLSGLSWSVSGDIGEID